MPQQSVPDCAQLLGAALGGEISRLRNNEIGIYEINQIAEILKTSPGSCPVFLSVRDYAKNLCVLKLGRAFQVNPNRFPVEELEEILGQGNVKLS